MEDSDFFSISDEESITIITPISSNNSLKNDKKNGIKKDIGNNKKEEEKTESSYFGKSELSKLIEKKFIEEGIKANEVIQINKNKENEPETKKLKQSPVTFKFPFPPYPSQKKMIKALITSFLNNQSLIIESPTGTGKTLTICSAIDAYLNLSHDKYKLQRQFDSDPTKQKFFILSRTHTQLSQVMKCLNQNFNISTTVLGSRNIYCLKKTDNKGCKSLRKEKKCQYFHKTNKLTKDILSNQANTLNTERKPMMEFPLLMEHPKNPNSMKENLREVPKFDIDSIKKLGKSCKGCPYYSSRDLNVSSVITLAPYNYLFDPIVARTSEVSFQDSIVIVDEAHNIDNICRDAGSLLLTQVDLENMTQELYYYMNKDPHLHSFINIMALIREYRNHKEGIFTGKEIVINLERLEKSFAEIKSIKELELDYEQIIESFLYTLNLIVKHPDVYSLKVEMENHFVKVQFYLNDPSIIFNNIKKTARSIVLLSGTMNPVQLIQNELLLNCDTHIMPHVLDKKRLRVYNITKTNKYELKGTYQNISQDWFVDEIIHSIKISRSLLQKRNIRGGILVFVPSYHLLNTIKGRMTIKDCYYENDERCLEKYSNKLDSNPALLAVYRGKLSEGMDFRDDLCRVLIAVGVPFPQIKDVCIVEKRKFNDKFSIKQEGEYQRRTLKSNIWYEGQALKAVNQAIGRIIRHKDDYGIVLLLDSRWSYLRKNLSKWIRDSIEISGQMTEMVKNIDGIFEYFNKLN